MFEGFVGLIYSIFLHVAVDVCSSGKESLAGLSVAMESTVHQSRHSMLGNTHTHHRGDRKGGHLFYLIQYVDILKVFLQEQFLKLCEIEFLVFYVDNECKDAVDSVG